jgi:hypothetical protein
LRKAKESEKWLRLTPKRNRYVADRPVFYFNWPSGQPQHGFIRDVRYSDEAGANITQLLIEPVSADADATHPIIAVPWWCAFTGRLSKDEFTFDDPAAAVPLITGFRELAPAVTVQSSPDPPSRPAQTQVRSPVEMPPSSAAGAEQPQASAGPQPPSPGYSPAEPAPRGEPQPSAAEPQPLPTDAVSGDSASGQQSTETPPAPTEPPPAPRPTRQSP